MKIGILSGAVKNAGDFLIVERSKKMLQMVYPDSEFITFNRLINLENRIKELNSCDILVLAGGPVYLEQTYPQAVPLVRELNNIKSPIITLGCGWYGKNDLRETIYDKYKFEEKTNIFFKKLSENSPLSCRDWLTYKVLKSNGYRNIVMTGCPAWYDINRVENTKHKNISMKYPKMICISDSGYKMNISKSLMLTQYIRETYPQAEVHYIFHRGIDVPGERGDKNRELYNKLQRVNGVIIHDISDSSEGFSIYDNCDFHIGFRVHAHIYNLSVRNISILFEEDGRGRGVNDALYLKGVRPYTYLNRDGKVELIDNKYFLDDVRFLFKEIELMQFSMYENAYEIMKKHYYIMINYIEQLKLGGEK